MNGTIFVRGLNPAKPWEEQVVFTASDRDELDRQADRARVERGFYQVRVHVQMTAREKSALTRQVMKRENRQCQKCKSKIDPKVVSLRYGEYHNPTQLVVLCRICRHASWRAAPDLGELYEEQMRAWLGNGHTGIEEERKSFLDFLRQEGYTQPLENLAALGPERAAEVLEELIYRNLFGTTPFRPKPSPWLERALKDLEPVDLPEAFRDAGTQDTREQ